MTPEQITKILEDASSIHPIDDEMKLIWKHRFHEVVAAIMALEATVHPTLDKEETQMIVDMLSISNNFPQPLELTALEKLKNHLKTL